MSSVLPQMSSVLPQGSSALPQRSSVLPHGSSVLLQRSSDIPQSSSFPPEPANNKRKVEELTTEEFYTSSFEEIPENGLIADAIIQQYKKAELSCLTTEMKSTALS
ncbi:uncharacterized protein LOC111701226 [Eurytemora carolleeae]|uniref:uncharacterized protein LOC111701226 n=1 Tax=Eurytemora carolleeae TaxID=1294199 RepID=UPI000C78E6B8|nr:uncharacterized protein LOC111701226 [Eurytemora carolleeae]|eukprot:XP_023328182.1 uncharacterized protein LOC111701226 [Eurytemora affinis]